MDSKAGADPDPLFRDSAFADSLEVESIPNGAPVVMTVL
jgi:hypothetical protein